MLRQPSIKADLAQRLRSAVGIGGFPVILMSFVGREQAVREVAALLEQCQLVTVNVTVPEGLR